MKKMKYILIIAAVVIALGIVFFLVRKSAPGPGGVPDETINRIEKVLYDSGMKKGPGDFPENEYQALDAETVSVTVAYGDGAFIHFDSNQKVPDGYWEAVDETMRLLEAAADK